MLRPAGTLDGASAAAFGRSLTDLSTTADMVVVDLDAARIPDLAAFVDALRPAAARLARPRKCLLFVNAPSALAGAVQSAGVPAATLAADAFPTPHPHWNGPGVDHAIESTLRRLVRLDSVAYLAPLDQAPAVAAASRNG